MAAFQGFANQAVRRLIVLDNAESLLNLQKTWELRREDIAAGRLIAERIQPRQAVTIEEEET